MTTIFGLNLFTWGGILAVIATYFLLQRGAVENAKNNVEKIKTHVTLTKDQILTGIDSLDEKSRLEIAKRMQPEFDQLSTEIKLSKEEVIKQAGDLDRESRREIFNSLSPEFASVKKEIKLSKEDLFERIKQLDYESKKEILKIIKPKLEFFQAKSNSSTNGQGKVITKLHFEVPSKVAIPYSTIIIKSDKPINNAKISRVQFLHGNRSSFPLNVQSGSKELTINVTDIDMNRYIEIILESDEQLNYQIETK